MIKETLRAHVAIVIRGIIQLITCLSTWLTTFQATFQRVHFRRQRGRHLHDFKGCSPNLRHVSRTHRVDLDWLSKRINFEHFFFMRCVRTTEQLADILTEGAFTAIQWMYLMRLRDIQPPSDLNVDRCLPSRISLFCSFSKTHLAMSNAYSFQRDFERGSWEEKAEDPSCGVRSAWRNPAPKQNWFLKLHLKRPNALYSMPCLETPNALGAT